MNGPDIFVVVCTRGDGYGHNSYKYLAWYFDEKEAKASVQSFVNHFDGAWYSVEQIPAGSPIPKQDRW